MISFKAKARAVDLLGKGQIADLPTAISELWKNGYDAYADNVFAALYAQNSYPDVHNNIFVIGDDGCGMSREDIIDKWLVLGTENKAEKQDAPQLDPKGKNTLNKEARVKMGEKGIGRLSVAYLGSPMLMITKQEDNQAQLLYIDWRMFELYDLFLDDVKLPIKTANKLEEIPALFESMKHEFIAPLGMYQSVQDITGIYEAISLRKEKTKQTVLKNDIITDALNAIIPQKIREKYIQAFFEGKNHGTIFIIFKAQEQLLSMYSRKNDDDKEVLDLKNDLRGALGAFCNPFEKTEKPLVKTSFVVVNEKGDESDELVSDDFFSVDNFKDADHVIEGNFDEYGVFNGTIRIYTEKLPYKYTPARTDITKPNAFGKIRLKFGYIQGTESESMLNSEQFSKYKDKLFSYGGLYVYRDGFRVLPYGRTDNDFLDFEQRRSKHMGHHFFSHRRMFGFVGITRQDNPKLIDKAGREGFISNTTYQKFRSDLIAFFKQLSKEFFSINAENTTKITLKDSITKRKESELKAQKAEEAEKRLERELRVEYTKLLDSYNENLANLELSLSEIEQELAMKNSEVDIAYDELSKLIAKWNKRKADLIALTPPKPVRFEPTQTHQKNIQKYTQRWEHIKESLNEQRTSIEAAEAKLKEHELLQSYEHQYKQFTNMLNNMTEDYIQQIPQIERKIRSILQSNQEELTKQLQAVYIQAKPQTVQEVQSALSALRTEFDGLQSDFREVVPPFIAQFKNINLSINLDSSVSYYKQIAREAQDLKELVLLGLAVEIIDHEFNTLYAQLEYTVQKLEPADNSVLYKEKLLNYVKQLSATYASVTPLYRSAGRFSMALLGSDILNYLHIFFREKLDSNKIVLEATQSFNNYLFKKHDSHFRAVYINIVNNAIYWISNKQEKKIILDYVDNKLLLINSGEPIEEHNLENIFKMFVSFRPNGRGLGLFISRQLLNEDGFELYATNDKVYNYLGGACFVIEPTANYFDNNNNS